MLEREDRWGRHVWEVRVRKTTLCFSPGAVRSPRARTLSSAMPLAFYLIVCLPLKRASHSGVVVCLVEDWAFDYIGSSLRLVRLSPFSVHTFGLVAGVQKIQSHFHRRASKDRVKTTEITKALGRKTLAAVGFEPTPPKRLEPKSSALDRSATLPICPRSPVYTSYLHYSVLFDSCPGIRS